MKKEVAIVVNVRENRIRVLRVNDIDYISLTDLARYANPKEPKIPIQTWMRNKDVILYLGLWERLNNKNFKGHKFTTFDKEAGRNSFYMSPQKWITETNAMGIVSRSGNNGGTFANPDIAFEFASWLSPEFKLYLITEFERLKKNEAYQAKISWSAKRELAKTNYLIHTEAIKENIVPTLTKKQKMFIYSNEADILDVALFGITAKEWKDNNPKLEGNIRDYASILQLVVLINLENLNANMIENGIPQTERLTKLNDIAKRQLTTLSSKQINNRKYLK